MSVDWENRLDMQRLREQRLARLNDALRMSELGSVLTFDFNNIRYMTGTHIGTWAVDKMIRFSVLPRGGAPVLWDFGSAARHHQLQTPWLDIDYAASHADSGLTGHEPHHGAVKVGGGARAGISTLRGTIGAGAKRAEDVAQKIYEVLAERGLQNEPIGVDIIEMPVLFAMQALGLKVVDGQQVFLEARRIKTEDEIGLLTHAASMVDAAYEELYEFLRPGVRENECVGLVAKTLYDLGSEHVEGVNAISGERCSPHPHVYSDRIVRPGDPAFFDILHSYNGCRHRGGEAGCHHRGHRPAMADGGGVRLPLRGGGLRPAVRPWRGPEHLGAADLLAVHLVRRTGGPRGGHGVRP
jgi:Xaa-Pro aminopeptidase